MERTRTPVVFVHGLWLHADSWSPWVEAFGRAGYAATAPGWPGDGATVAETRQRADAVAGHGLAAVVEHFARAIAALGTKPIVIGHSFGGLIAQRLLGQNLAAAAIAIDPAPPKGVLFLPLSALRVASVALRNPANRSRAVSLTRGQFRYGFGNAISATESDELYERWAIPSPGRPLFEAATANLSPGSPAKVETGNSVRGPLLITAGGRDRTVPGAVSRQTLRLYRHSPAVTDYREFPDRGHSLTIDGGWREVADASLAWLKSHSL
ncbi:MAG TPA: alpha/beta fold hydrolase [Gaiellaceae bacterium]|nr:alpha/beta fold hydrolase [Gaiellaceae bacterium]